MPDEIVDGVYDITCKTFEDGRRYRVFLFDGDVPTLFDAGFADSTDRMFAGIEETGVEPERLVITHADHDHVGGFDAIVDRYGVETWVPEASETDFEHEPDNRYGDGTAIGDRFETVHVPGHGPDSSAIIDEDAGIAVFGDLMSGADQRGLPEGYLLLPPAVYSTDLNELEGNLEKLLTYEFDVALVFHGSSVLNGASEKIERFVNFPGKPE